MRRITLAGDVAEGSAHAQVFERELGLLKHLGAGRGWWGGWWGKGVGQEMLVQTYS